MKKKIIFLTGTRADYGKLKSLIKVVEISECHEAFIFVTGMHMLGSHGNTYKEIENDKFKNIFKYKNQKVGDSMDIALSKTIKGFTEYAKKIQPDLIIVHGDRLETLAGAIVGSFNNILTGHIEGGEVSGTIDELIRHSVSKLSHCHFVANNEAKKRLIQMGENLKSIFVIGSPDMDIMKSKNLPDIKVAKSYYDINFKKYSILMYHPVTTSLSKLKSEIDILIDILINSKRNYIVIYPNNDSGSQIIIDKYLELKTNLNFKIYPSMRFEYFLIFLKNADFIIGNSSAGIREAPFYGVPTINIGNRQQGRSKYKSIFNVPAKIDEIKFTINKIENIKFKRAQKFGKGDSSKQFSKIINDHKIWNTNVQKIFNDLK